MFIITLQRTDRNLTTPTLIRRKPPQRIRLIINITHHTQSLLFHNF